MDARTPASHDRPTPPPDFFGTQPTTRQPGAPSGWTGAGQGGPTLPPPPPTSDAGPVVPPRATADAGPAVPPPPPFSPPFPPRRGRSLGRGLGRFVRLGVAAAILGGGYVVRELNAADRDSTGAVVGAGEVAGDELRIGDCFDAPTAEEFEAVQALPCAQPHDAEVFHVLELERAAYPSDPELEEVVARDCLPAFGAYVGEPFETSELTLTFTSPAEDAWSQGDRTVHCALLTMDGSKLSGSMRGSGR